MSSTTINNPEPSANALSHQKVSRLTSTALFAALICVTTAYIFHIPFGVNVAVGPVISFSLFLARENTWKPPLSVNIGPS